MSSRSQIKRYGASDNDASRASWTDGVGHFGKPIIATRHAGIPDAVKDGYNGILVEENNPDELGKAIMKLYKDKKLRKRLGDNGKKWVKNFNWDKISDKILKGLK